MKTVSKIHRVRLGSAKVLTKLGVGKQIENGLAIAQFPTA